MADQSSETAWRIDDLAHEAGISVDTIRYYQREGLLPPGTRRGRTKRYGSEHLERLQQIRDLQARRFSLAAIRALLDERAGLVEVVFGDAGGSFDYGALVSGSGVSRSLADALRTVGVLRDPAEFGRDAYDATDLEMLSAVAELSRLGLPDHIVVGMCRIYASGVERMQAEVLSLFLGEDDEWEPEELDAFQDRAAANADKMVSHTQRLAEYVHNRTLQRLTLAAIERSRQE